MSRQAFEIQSPQSPGLRMAAAVMAGSLVLQEGDTFQAGNIQTNIPPYARPGNLFENPLPRGYVQRVLHAWEVHQEEDLPVLNGEDLADVKALSLFSAEDSATLKKVTEEYTPIGRLDVALEKLEMSERVLRRELLTELAGFAAIPRIIAGDHHLLRKAEAQMFIEKYAANSDATSILSSVIMTPEELSYMIPWRLDTPDLLTFKPNTIARCGSIVLDQTLSWMLQRRHYRNRQHSAKDEPRYYAALLANQEFGRTVSKRLGDNNEVIDRRYPRNGSSRSVPLARGANTCEIERRHAYMQHERFMEGLHSTDHGMQFAEQVRVGSGDTSLLKGADIQREYASRTLTYYLEAACRTLFDVNYGNATSDAYPAEGLCQTHDKTKYLNSIVGDDDRIEAVNLRIEPYQNESRAGDVLNDPSEEAVKITVIVAVVPPARPGEAVQTCYRAKTYLVQTRKSASTSRINLNGRSIYKKLSIIRLEQMLDSPLE